MKQIKIIMFIMAALTTVFSYSQTTKSYTNQIFTAFDIETTGFDARYEKIVEIAAVKFCNGKITSQKSWLVNPGKPIPKHARDVHGITDMMVAKAPTFSVVATNFIDFIGDSILIAHNASFDSGFIYTEMENNNIAPIQNPILDSLKMARQWYPELKRHNLQFLSEKLHFAGDTYHRALDDSIYVQKLFVGGVNENPQYKNIDFLIKKTAINPKRIKKKLQKKLQ